MITDRNKLNFVTIQWLWFLCFVVVCSGTATLAHNVETTQQQQQQQTQAQHQTLSQQQSTLQLPQSLPQSQSHHHQQLQLQQHQQQVESNGPPPQQDVTVRNFSPRMDYNNNEWRPVGRGDPLKNDPTFDYSPPTLDRVRYWADPEKDKDKIEEAAIIDAKLKKANPGKNEILLLGVTGDRVRGTPVQPHTHAQHVIKNAKGETPLLQPKYTSIRRSYYAHQLPTHLMPPPMQPMVPATQSHQSQPQQSQPAMVHMLKPAHTEYRHNMPMMSAHSYMSPSPMAQSKPYHMSSASTQPWMHSSSPSSMVTSMPSQHMKPSAMAQHYAHHPHDTHHQESVNYMTYTRPSMSSTPMVMAGHGHDYYSPNSIRGSAAVHKTSSSSRKPWIHDLLQKEFIKPMKPTPGPNAYHTDAPPKPPHMETHFEPMLPPRGISTTYAPVTFVTPTTTPATTQSAIYITSSSTYRTTASPPVYTQAATTTTTTHAPRTTTTLSPTRLLIPNTSNLAYRPTISPMKMTTDALFSHYNQPEKPLRGPMYLIIEGHSKVKTYGKDELDPHKPKIVPVISNREPVVRIADPNEKRGTPETFQVKHLHTKTTQAMQKPTTTTPKMGTTAKSTTTKKPMISSTAKPISTAKPSTAKPGTAKPTNAKPNTATKKAVVKNTTTTAKPATTKPVPKLSVTTTAAATTVKPKPEQKPSKDVKIPSKSPMKGDKLSPSNLNSLEIAQKPSQALLTDPPTAMQGFLSLLDSSLDKLFQDDATAPAGAPMAAEKKESTTKLKPIDMNTQPQIEGRVSTKLQAIKAEDYDDDADDDYEQFLKTTTEYLPRETRQIFDYDQLPESRIGGDKDNINYGGLIENIEDEEDLSAFGFDDEYEEEDDDNQHQLIKRIDSLVSSTEDLDDEALAELEEDDLEALDLARQQKAKKA